MKKHSVVYLSHGGGPLPLLGEPSHAEMVKTFSTLADKLIKPSAILVISAHWEEERPTVTSAVNPTLFYDYYGFPEESYRVTYPVPGAPKLAEDIYGLLEDKGFQPGKDPDRGLDHGVFIPLKIIYPEAHIPCLQLSLVKGLRPDIHIELGKALAELQHEHLLIIGSGFSFHNMRAFFQPPSFEGQTANNEFARWLVNTCCDTELSEVKRRTLLLDWESAPGARYCHPREEHLLPLHVCYGFAGAAAADDIELEIMGKKANIFFW